jgi:hypothetical protein
LNQTKVQKTELYGPNQSVASASATVTNQDTILMLQKQRKEKKGRPHYSVWLIEVAKCLRKRVNEEEEEVRTLLKREEKEWEKRVKEKVNHLNQKEKKKRKGDTVSSN